MALAGAAWYGWDYWTVGQYLVSTDDAYIKADNTTISPKVSGYLHDVLVGDNERVKAGQTLARIDDRDFKVALVQAKADVAAARAAIASKEAQLDVQQTVINAAKATVNVDEATATFAGQENKRYTDLASTGYGSVQNAQQAQSRIASAQAAILRGHRQPCIRGQAGRPAQGRDRPGQCRAGPRRGPAEPGRAQSQLHHHHSADRRHRRQPHAAHRPICAGRHSTDVAGARERRLCDRQLQETQLTDVREGQAVEIEVDTFPGRPVHGHVDSIAPASGQEFALLPPDNATGNFTKIVQRIPVKIVLDGGNNPPIALRPGMSVIPTIETRAAAHGNGTHS